MKRFWHQLTARYTEVVYLPGADKWAVETGHLPARVWTDALRYGWGVALYNLKVRLFA